MTILGDHQGIGFANMNDTQTTQFAKILAHAVEKYGLDGIGFDDEYADYNTSLVSGSFGNLILKLRDEMPAGKLITLFQYGNVGSTQINASAGAAIDHVYSDFGYNTYISVSGVDPIEYAPLSINLGYAYSLDQITTYGAYAYAVKQSGYGSIMHFNLRRTSDVDPTTLFSVISQNIYGSTVSVSSSPSNAGNRPQDWTFVSSGHYITMDDVNAQ